MPSVKTSLTFTTDAGVAQGVSRAVGAALLAGNHLAAALPWLQRSLHTPSLHRLASLLQQQPSPNALTQSQPPHCWQLLHCAAPGKQFAASLT